MKKDLILIIGASGTVGSELARLLKAQGENVRLATSQKPQTKEQVQINIASRQGLREAFEGVSKAFFLSPPGFSDQYSMLSPLIAEAQKYQLKKVVLMTALGANAVETAPFRRAEIELEKSGLNYNIIRPNWFLQNFNTFWVHAIKAQGKILLPAGKAKTSFIDAKDISAVAARLLTTETFNNRAFDITGPESLTHDEVAGVLSKVTGRKISYQEITPEELKQGLLSAGLPEDYVDFLNLIFGFLREGYNAEVNNTVSEIIGREPRSILTYAEENKAAWI